MNLISILKTFLTSKTSLFPLPPRLPPTSLLAANLTSKRAASDLPYHVSQ